MRKLSGIQVAALAEFLGGHDPRTGAQTRGPVWRGRLPRRAEPTDWTTVDPAAYKANKEVEERRHPRMAFMPDSNLGRLLMDGRVRRPLRRAIISAVQAPDTRRRVRLQRRVQAALAALGV